MAPLRRQVLRIGLILCDSPKPRIFNHLSRIERYEQHYGKSTQRPCPADVACRPVSVPVAAPVVAPADLDQRHPRPLCRLGPGPGVAGALSLAVPGRLCPDLHLHFQGPFCAVRLEPVRGPDFLRADTLPGLFRGLVGGRRLRDAQRQPAQEHALPHRPDSRQGRRWSASAPKWWARDFADHGCPAGQAHLVGPAAACWPGRGKSCFPSGCCGSFPA